MTADPPVRADGTCVVCGKPRRITRDAMRYAGPALEADPFCSRPCAQQWHGVAVPETAMQKAARLRAEAVAA